MTVRVHVDTDIGGDMDDLCALAMLLKCPGVEISGITTVTEHGGTRAGYVRDVLALAGRANVPVAAGADVRLGNLRFGAELQAEAVYWPGAGPPLPGPVERALDLLEQNIERGVRIIAIGPYTNLWLLERRRPGILARASLYLMGWSLRPTPSGFPTWTSEWDYNVQCDAVAAQAVIEASNATLIPLEMTAQTALRQVDLARLDDADPVARLVALQARAFAREYCAGEKYADFTGVAADMINFQHDPLACAVATGWDGAVVEDVRVTAELRDGWLCASETAEGRAHRLVTAVDAQRFNQFWLDTVTGAAINLKADSPVLPRRQATDPLHGPDPQGCPE